MGWEVGRVRGKEGGKGARGGLEAPFVSEILNTPLALYKYVLID